jgi:DNA-directed RNA polymerase specialized sigma24 family protein
MIQQSDLESQTSVEAELDQLTYSAYLLTLDLAHVNGNPILSLDSDARVAFVLHHVFGYNIEQSAALVEADERRFRARLRSAYVQLAPEQLMRGAHLTDIREQYAVV